MMFGVTKKLAARLAAVLLVIAAASLAGCGGSAGVENGSIHGKVFANASGGSAAAGPLADVAVVAVRQGSELEFIRNTKTDANGEFVLTDLPTGTYILGFDKEGFRTITTEEGNSTDRTAVGNQIRVYVEAGSTSEAPDVTLIAQAQQGDGTLVLTLLDAITAEPITHATVIAGSAVTSNGGTNGVYTLSVPVIVQDPDAPAGTMPSLTTVVATADGYDEMSFTVQLVANETVNMTRSLNPVASMISGTIQISAFQTLYQMSDIVITSDRVPRAYLRQNIESSGFFTVMVPCSNAFQTRQFNLRFQHPLLHEAVVSNIVAARPNGTRQLTSPVVMQPVTVDLTGTVADSNGNAPNQLNPSGLPDTVTVRETGQMANIINGSYTIPGVPTASTQIAPNQLNLDVVAYNPFAAGGGGGVGAVENGTMAVTPVSDGTANPTFQVPLITTNSGGS